MVLRNLDLYLGDLYLGEKRVDKMENRELRMHQRNHDLYMFSR